jgi:manganese-dependent ADP-ribose/CDP-alcohol diphosphatase
MLVLIVLSIYIIFDNCSSLSMSAPPPPPLPPLPLLRIGIIADVQHAPIDDGFSYSGTPRYYRHSLSAASSAARKFQEAECDFAIDLGDVIDGQCKNLPGGPGPVLDSISETLSEYKGEWFHTYGNHEMYCFDRQTIGERLGVPFVTEEVRGGVEGGR